MASEDFFSTDFFNPPNPKAGPKAPGPPKPPKIVPDTNQLFQVQRNALTTVNALQDLLVAIGHDHKGAKELNAALRAAENTYRVIRTYLKENIHV